MRSKSKLFYLVFFVFISQNIFAQDLSVVSWNLRDFGKSRDSDEIKLIAKELRNVDLVCIQEVVAKDPGGAKAVARLAEQLNRMGSNWDYMVSNPTSSESGHKKERYAFLWKTHKVSMKGRAQLINELSANVTREPFVGVFQFEEQLIHIVNYHACTHNKSFPERIEIQLVSQWILNQSFENTILVGDMNLVIGDEAFDLLLKKGFKSVLHGEKTSLKRKCKNGVYLSRAEDNILYKFKSLSYKSGTVLDFVTPQYCEDVKWMWIAYSDHLPIALTLNHHVN